MAPGNDVRDAASPAAPKFGPAYLLRLWLGTTAPVGRRAYAASGFGLMLWKYAVEAAVIGFYTGQFFTPLQFLTPTLDSRRDFLRSAPEWLPWIWFVWTLPFLWIAVTMSVRRAADAGHSPWSGLLMLVPIVNYLVMIALCLEPSAPGPQWSPGKVEESDQERIKSAAMAVGLSIVFGGAMLAFSVYVLGEYGASLFVGTPLLMGAIASYLYNRPYSRSTGASVLVGTISVSAALGVMLLFALEGMICVMMAAPLVVPLGPLGALIGKSIADAGRQERGEFVAVVLVLPLLAVGESLLMQSPEYVILTTVEVNAPPEAVWNNVVQFPDLPETKPWYFSLGEACPQRARIDGSGIGATRYCEFTTGTFVEPITAWEKPRRLAFDVTQQPEPLFELSPYRDLHPPHLHGYLRSTHGEFLLVPLKDRRTRLEGRTWYKFEMYPQWYWSLWSDLFIHRIHERVLRHIKTISEAQAGV